MRSLATICCLACLLAPGLALAAADRPPHPQDAAAACAAVRDAALDALDQEALAVAVAVDNDTAVAGAPEHDLLKAKEELLREIEQERQAVLGRYRRCVGASPASR